MIEPHASGRTTQSVGKGIEAAERSGKDMRELYAAVDIVAEDGKLPAGYNPHMLTAEWGGVWECHIETDWLLIYEVAADEVILLRTGMHSDLFG